MNRRFTPVWHPIGSPVRPTPLLGTRRAFPAPGEAL